MWELGSQHCIHIKQTRSTTKQSSNHNIYIIFFSRQHIQTQGQQKDNKTLRKKRTKTQKTTKRHQNPKSTSQYNPNNTITEQS